MDGRNPDTRFARLEDLSGVPAYHRRSRRSVLVYLLLYSMILTGAVIFLLAPRGTVLEGGRWFYGSWALWWTTIMASTLGHALCGGTFGRRRERWGSTLRKGAALGAIPAGVFVFAAIGYMVFGLVGAAVGGILALLTHVATLLHQRRNRAMTEDAPDVPAPRASGSE